MNDIVKQGIEKEAGISLPNNWQADFVAYINHLINTDFERLIYLLYRIDVSESKIKNLLEGKHDMNAAELIAQAIIDRQIEKIEARKKFTKQTDIDEQDKW